MAQQTVPAPRRSPDVAEVARRPARGWLWTVAGALAVVVLRLSLSAPVHPDEAGYLLVATAARPGGPFLYGPLWVDRPPLLVAVFRLADDLGGPGALRASGLLAAVALVVAAGSAGRSVAGERGRRWAVLAAVPLVATPLLGAPVVDGEVLASPLVMASVAVGLRALRVDGGGPVGGGGGGGSGPRRVALAAVAGLLAVSALAVKQDFADAAVFLEALLLARVLRGELTRRRGAVLAAATAAGAAAGLVAVIAWSLAWGAGPAGLWHALISFREASLHVMTTQSSAAPARRARQLAQAAVLSGLVPLLFTAALASVRRRWRPTAVGAATAAMALVGLPAIALGGSYWVHYLVELVPVSALAAAGLSARARPARACGAGVVALALVSCLVSAGAQVHAASSTGCTGSAGAGVAGRWLAARARPGDSVTTVYGGADVLLAAERASSGAAGGRGSLRVAYPYLWTLPVRTLDPQLRRLVASVSGPGAATWVVVTMPEHSWGLDADGRLASALSSRYTTAGVVCGLRIELRDGLTRPPHAPGPRPAATHVPHTRRP